MTHGEQTQSVDWANETQGLQRIVDQMLGVLPGERITAQYGQPGGGLEGESARRLWQQFLPGEAGASETLPVYGGAGQPYQQFTPEQMANAFAQGTFGSAPAWDPATGQWVVHGPGVAPPAASDVFQTSPYWQHTEQNLFNASPQGQYDQQYQQVLDQYIQQMQGLNQQAPQLLQGMQTALQGAPVSTMAPQGPGAPGFTSNAPGTGGGMDLTALLRQMGYLS